MPIVLADARQPDCPIVLANRAFLGLTGYSADEVLGRNCRFLQGNATSPAAIAELRFAVAEGRSTSVEILNYRKDGTRFWNQLHLSPIQDDDGKLAFYFASQIDVTEFRKVQSLEASEHRLLMEVDHRAKNVLAVVDSIVRLSKADEPAMYAASVQRRVQSLSQAHAILSSTRWTGVDFRRIIEAQIARFQHERIALIGPPVAVSPEIVQPLSLILHELIDNAVTHGALSREALGHLTIKWRNNAEGGFQFDWREKGSNRDCDQNPNGFGNVIVKALVEKQLGGRLVREWRKDGLAVWISLPTKSGAG